MSRIENCQLPSVPVISEGKANPIIPEDKTTQSIVNRFKRRFAVPWNYYIKPWLKKVYKRYFVSSKMPDKVSHVGAKTDPHDKLSAGDWVRVRSEEEIRATLDTFRELKGCAFLPNMAKYCGTTQKVLQPINQFLDERDYKVKKTSGLVTLDGVICKGTPMYGRCDRCCHYFWRVEWLEKINHQ